MLDKTVVDAFEKDYCVKLSVVCKHPEIIRELVRFRSYSNVPMNYNVPLMQDEIRDSEVDTETSRGSDIFANMDYNFPGQVERAEKGIAKILKNW